MAPLWLSVLLLLLLSHGTRTHALPPGFRDEGISRVFGVVSFAFCPRPDQTDQTMMLAVVKQGTIQAILNYDSDTPADAPYAILDISDKICHVREHGIMFVVPHPRFGIDNTYIYIFYTYDKYGNQSCKASYTDGVVNRVSRFTMDTTFPYKLHSEKVLLTTAPIFERHHNGGDMLFGNDGYLYIAMGDVGEQDADVAISQNMASLFGKILRIDVDSEDLVPADNPFADHPDRVASCRVGGYNGHALLSAQPGQVCPEIYALGLRNPFCMSKHPHVQDETHLIISDVGGKTWEEISISATPGANFGWPEREGPCAFGFAGECDNSPGHYHEPMFWYRHDPEGNGCILGNAVPPRGVFPAEYEDSIFFVEHVFHEIRVVQPSAHLKCLGCNPPRSGYENVTFYNIPDGDPTAGRPVDLRFGPYKNTQAMYYSTRWGNKNLRRIVYDGAVVDNYPPVVVLQVQPVVEAEVLLVGSELIFNASASHDPEGSHLHFDWDFGDGTPHATTAAPRHAYVQPGEFLVTLTVTDHEGAASEATTTLAVGHPPIVELMQPPNGTTFAVGDILTVSGHAWDWKGNPIPTLVWEVRQHHNNHYHPFLDPTPGNNLQLAAAPDPEDFWAATRSHLEILLTATDEDGLSTTVSRLVMPQLVSLNFDTLPTGISALVLDDYTLPMPAEVISWVGHRLKMRAPPVTQDGLVFYGWSDGWPDTTHSILVDESLEASTVTAIYVQAPSSTPSLIPSAMPSSFPSRIPSSIPSDLPTLFPSVFPTKGPSQGPSGQPSELQTEIALGMNSTAPSEIPSITVDDMTMEPTVPSTQTPSGAPSLASQDGSNNTVIQANPETPLTLRKSKSVANKIWPAAVVAGLVFVITAIWLGAGHCSNRATPPAVKVKGEVSDVESSRCLSTIPSSSPHTSYQGVSMEEADEEDGVAPTFAATL